MSITFHNLRQVGGGEAGIVHVGTSSEEWLEWINTPITENMEEIPRLEITARVGRGETIGDWETTRGRIIAQHGTRLGIDSSPQVAY